MLLGSELIALHTQQVGVGRHATKIEHMPIHHQRFRDPKLHLRAEGIGPQTTAVIDALFQKRSHSELAVRAASGILGLIRDYSKTALEAACGRAIELNVVSYKNIAELLKAAKQARETVSQKAPSEAHEYVRGPGYYDAPAFVVLPDQYVDQPGSYRINIQVTHAPLEQAHVA